MSSIKVCRYNATAEIGICYIFTIKYQKFATPKSTHYTVYLKAKGNSQDGGKWKTNITPNTDELCKPVNIHFDF